MKVGDGRNTRFWEDKWTRKGRLSEVCKRLYSLEREKEASVAARGGGRGVWEWCWRREPRGREIGELEELSRILEEDKPSGEGKDCASWSLERYEGYSVKRLRELMEEKRTGRSITVNSTRWCRAVPKKILTFVWRAARGRIPTRDTLDKMGVDLNSTLCPRCEKEVETLDHALLKCDSVRKVWEQVVRWWNINLGSLDSVQDILNSGSTLGLSIKGLTKWHGVVWCTLYFIWGNRNTLVFQKDGRKIEDCLFDIQLKTFDWVTKRDKNLLTGWQSWLTQPFEG